MMTNKLNSLKSEKKNELLYNYKGKKYPNYLKQGNAISYIMPYAKYFLKGDVLDIGGTKEWHYDKSTYVNIDNKDGYHAMKLPKKKFDSIISSHCLEHLKEPYYALKYWTSRLNNEGCLFLYLPHIDMEYWTFDNPKHLHILTPEMITGWLKRLGYKDIITSGRDLYYSYTVIGWRK